MLLLPEGQTDKANEPSKKQYFFENREALDRKSLSSFCASKVKARHNIALHFGTCLGVQ
jgi:hypothetical protein